MPFSDLREFVCKLDEAGELAHVRKEVDPKYEVGAICKTIHNKGRQALLFERVRGCSMPVTTELLGTFKRIAIAIGAAQPGALRQNEGQVSIPPEIGDEGPYGEFCGYSVGTVIRERMWTIQCMTLRENPLYHGFYLCKGINEEGVIKSVTASVQVYNELKPGHPAIKKVYCTEAGIGIFHCYIQIDERLKRPGMVNNILAAAVGVKGSRMKHIFVFDDDIDIMSPEEVEWAVATRVQADKDVFIIPNTFGLRLDPSATSDGVTAKMFVDATKGKDFRSEGLALPPEDVWQQVRNNWDSYFVG